MVSHSIKLFVQETTFSSLIFSALVSAAMASGYISPASAKLPAAPSVIGLQGSPNVGATLHQVQKGDSLYSLTQMYQVDAAAIAASNGISAATPLPIGTQLVIPPVDGIIYKVQPRDTLGQIAKLYQVPQELIAKASGLMVNDALMIDQPLVIPGDVHSLLTRRKEQTIKDLTLKRERLRQRLRIDSNISPQPLLSAQSWSSRFNFQDDLISSELATLTTSEARMTTVELFQLSRDIATIERWLEQHEQAIAAASLQEVPINPPDPVPSSLPTSPEHSSVMIWPTEGTISSGFGWRWGRIHKGIDIAAPIGTPVWAAASGVVEFAGWDDSGYGNAIDIRHHDGFLTRYAHLSDIYIQQGSVVNQSQVIGAVGSTGNSTGPHLHFETIPPSGVAVDPIAYLLKP